MNVALVVTEWLTKSLERMRAACVCQPLAGPWPPASLSFSVMRLNRGRIIAFLVLIGSVVPGCMLPYPHTTLRYGEIHGTVLDAHTRDPVKGATIVITEFSYGIRSYSSVSRVTDASGHFRFKETRNFHLARYGLAEGRDWPWPHRFDHATVTCPGYIPQKFEGWGEVNIMIQPKP